MAATYPPNSYESNKSDLRFLYTTSASHFSLRWINNDTMKYDVLLFIWSGKDQMIFLCPDTQPPRETYQ